jgi:hypothetical protein
LDRSSILSIEIKREAFSSEQEQFKNFQGWGQIWGIRLKQCKTYEPEIVLHQDNKTHRKSI